MRPELVTRWCVCKRNEQISKEVQRKLEAGRRPHEQISREVHRKVIEMWNGQTGREVHRKLKAGHAEMSKLVRRSIAN